MLRGRKPAACMDQFSGSGGYPQSSSPLTPSAILTGVPPLNDTTQTDPEAAYARRVPSGAKSGDAAPTAETIRRTSVPSWTADVDTVSAYECDLLPTRSPVGLPAATEPAAPVPPQPA